MTNKLEAANSELTRQLAEARQMYRKENEFINARHMELLKMVADGRAMLAVAPPFFLDSVNLQAAIDAAVAEEREACAKLCDDKHQEWKFHSDDFVSGPSECAAAIRERGKGCAD
jgi:hypothetical protein